MRATSAIHVAKIRTSVDGWRKISDRLFSIGPFGVGLDGLLTIIPAVGGAYSLGVGGFLIAQAWRVRASKATMAKMAALVAADTLLGEVPVVGDVFDFFFRAHAMSARLLNKEIDATHFVDDSRSAIEAAGRLNEHHAARKAAGKARLVFLRD
jgi:uncharacterized protein DUF4112